MPPSPVETTTNTGEGFSSPPSKNNNVDNNQALNDSKTESNSNQVVDNEAFGSGLAAFFGDFSPHQSDIQNKSIGFSTGLSRLPAPTDPIENATHIEATIGVKYIDGGLQYGQWRNKEKEYLTDYLMLRLHPHPDNEEATPNNGGDNDTFSSSESEEDVLEPESQLGMETQEPFVAEQQSLAEQGKSSRTRTKKSRRNTIPYVRDCLHDLSKLEFLDLHARTLSLDLSRIDKVWRLRDTKRSGALTRRSIRKPVFESCAPKTPQQQLLQRLIFEEKEEDGPVATIYKQVIHFEVQQLRVGGPGDYSERTRTGGKRFPQRIKVFFYNSYATAISEWLKEQQKESGTKRKRNDSADVNTSTTDIVMSLSNVPAKCIFPYAVDPRNWREKQDLVDYCLCIGDRSIAKTKTNQQQDSSHDNKEHQIRFDSNEMEIRLMAVVTTTRTSLTETATGSIVTKDVIDDVDASSELILSRRTLSKEFLSSSSSEEITPKVVGGEEQTEVPKGLDERENPLQKHWESYKTNRRQGMVATNKQNERPPLRQLNNHRPQTQGRSPTNEEKRVVPRIVEPMVVEGAAQRRSDSKEVTYVRLGDIANMVNQSIDAGRGCNFKVNLYASIVAVTPPRITKRGDWMIAATLIDESCQTPMTINIFCRKQNGLPKLIYMGDVIRIHRAALEKWYDKIQLQGLKPTQYVVIRKSQRKWHVIPTAPKYFTFNRSDEERSQALWRWANRHSEKSPSMKPEHCFSLDQMLHLQNEDDETTFANKDITVMVVQKLRYQSSDALPHGLLRVWDGTGKPPSDPYFMPAKILNPPPEEQRDAAYPRAIETVIQIHQQLQTSMDSMEIPISLCGRVSNVVVWEKSHWALICEHIPVGTFLRLRNVHIPQRWEANNFRSIFMHDKSWMTALPTNNFEVRSLLVHHNERIRKGNGTAAYNREFGGPHALPTCKFVGTGLSDFRQQAKARVYTGAVYVGEPTDDDPNGTVELVTVADRSGSFQALAGKTVRQELQNLLPMNFNRRFLVTIRMIVLNAVDERKHFVLTNLAPMD